MAPFFKLIIKGLTSKYVEKVQVGGGEMTKLTNNSLLFGRLSSSLSLWASPTSTAILPTPTSWPSCFRRCRIMLCFNVKRAWQTLHSNGRSPAHQHC